MQLVLFHDNERVHLSIGNLSGRNHDPGVEIGSSPEGPFYGFPLQRHQLVEPFGDPVPGQPLRDRPPT